MLFCCITHYLCVNTSGGFLAWAQEMHVVHVGNECTCIPDSLTHSPTLSLSLSLSLSLFLPLPLPIHPSLPFPSCTRCSCMHTCMVGGSHIFPISSLLTINRQRIRQLNQRSYIRHKFKCLHVPIHDYVHAHVVTMPTVAPAMSYYGHAHCVRFMFYVIILITVFTFCVYTEGCLVG